MLPQQKPLEKALPLESFLRLSATLGGLKANAPKYTNPTKEQIMHQAGESD